MREKLEKREGQRGWYIGTVHRFGSKKFRHHTNRTVCLVDIRDSRDEQVADHLWMLLGRQLESLKIEIGDKVQFKARVMPYWKGYRGDHDNIEDNLLKDYGLKHPSCFSKVKDIDFNAPVAQRTEQEPSKLKDGGSIPPGGSNQGDLFA